MFAQRMMRMTQMAGWARGVASSAVFSHIPMGPADPILGVTAAFASDKRSPKLNLGVGAYRDDNGIPVVLDCVLQASKEIVLSGKDNEYAGIGGVPEFCAAAADLALGSDSPALAEQRVVSLQSVSGTGANRVAMEFISRWMAPGNSRTIALPNPTWGNHIPLAVDSGLDVVRYRYFDAETRGLDFTGMLEDLYALERGSPVLLHACAHNPTGVDPTPEQWAAISQVIGERSLFPLIDMAYQGFASGDVNKDAAAVRMMVEHGHSFVLATSFAKNMGLYGQRIGSLIFVTGSPEEAAVVDSQAKIIIRPMYSNPPIHGARVVHKVLSDIKLRAQWLVEVQGMANRIKGIRENMVAGLVAAGSPHDWSHISNQIGMFCYSGLSPDHVSKLAAEHGVYMTSDGRMSMAGINSANINHLVAAIHDVTKDTAL